MYIQNSGERLLTTTGGIVELGTFNDREWFDSFRRHPEDDLFWTETRVLQRLPAVESGRPVISIFRRLSPMIGVRVPGMVVSNIYRDRLKSFLEQLKGSPDQRIVILDDAGEVVFSELESYVGGADDRYRSSSSQRRSLRSFPKAVDSFSSTSPNPAEAYNRAAVVNSWVVHRNTFG